MNNSYSSITSDERDDYSKVTPMKPLSRDSGATLSAPHKGIQPPARQVRRG